METNKMTKDEHRTSNVEWEKMKHLARDLACKVNERNLTLNP